MDTILYENSLLQHFPNYVPWNSLVDPNGCSMDLAPFYRFTVKIRKLKALGSPE